MKKERSPFRGLLGRAQKSFVRSRPGSVLILVVALLVLMALIGTAYMSMAQQDRVISAQHTNNNEIDLLMDGLANILRSSVATELFNQSKYRPGAGYNVPNSNGYNHFTGLGLDQTTLNLAGFTSTNTGSPFVSARAPELFQEIGTNNGISSNAGNAPTWSFITAPLIGGQFSSPIAPVKPAVPFLYGQVPATNIYTYLQRSSRMGSSPLYPGVYPGTNLPAWVDDPSKPAASQNAVVAADADGDGVADAGLIKLPIGSINGLTYYAAFRIVDNASAVNVNTAWQHNPMVLPPATPSAGTGPLPGDFFPSSIDLAAFAAGSDAGPKNDLGTPGSGQTNLLMQYRFGTTGTVTPVNTWSAFDDSGTGRADIAFSTALEASWMQLGRRVNYPGWASSGVPFSAFQLGDTIGLAHDFLIRNPSLAASPLELHLLNSLLVSYDPAYPIPTSPYAPGATLAWYDTNFAFLRREFTSALPSNPVPLRSMLTTQNPVTNFAPNKFNDRGIYAIPTPSSVPYAFGDTVLDYNGHRYVCVNPYNAGVLNPLNVAGPVQPSQNANGMVYTPGVSGFPKNASIAWAYDNDTWALMPWTDAPTKISVNTGTFGQLYAAYWSVMAEQTASVNGPVTTAPFNNVAIPGGFTSRMFRSPMRCAPPTAGTPVQVGLSPTQVMQLRAALAAVNTIDMRDNDDDVTSRQVALTPAPGEAATFPVVFATVYGQEPQPFITEIYATNQQSNATPTADQGYVAIKLFNPYNFPLVLTNYRLGTIVRSSAPPTPTVPPNLTITEVVPSTATFWTGSPTQDPPTIPANGFIIITSASTSTPPFQYTAPGAIGMITMPVNVVTPPVHGTPPPAAGVPQIACYGIGPNLLNVMLNGGNELVLLRPRQATNGAYGASGQLTSAPVPGIPPNIPPDTFAEGAPTGANLYEMVPVDSYDFTGLDQIPPGNALGEKAIEWHYLRPSDAEGTTGTLALDQQTSWHWVYPGHYNFHATGYTLEAVPGSLSLPPRLSEGTHRGTFPGGSWLAGTILDPTGITPAPVTADELWTMGQYFNPVRYKTANLYRDIPLRLNTCDSAGPNNVLHISRASSTAEPLGFPYGGFARNADIMQVPFIGSYRLQLPSQYGTSTFLELNPVTMDSVMALAVAQTAWNEGTTDSETNTPSPGNCDPLTLKVAPAGVNGVAVYENVGRFCPLNPIDYRSGNTTSAVPIDDYGTLATSWRYHFATRLLDYLTVQSPQQDYLPDVDPAASDVVSPANGSLLYKYYYTTLSKTVVPFPIANSISTVLNGEFNNPSAATEQSVGVQGLININTAPWRVLATVPWLPPSPSTPGTDNGPRSMNAAIAMSIVYYRDIQDPITGQPHGPFKNLFELNNVPITVASPFVGSVPPGTFFKDVLRVSPPYNGYTDLNKGDLQAAYTSPIVGHMDITQGDFESQFLMMDRISNLATTRSDYFTAYVLLQGWKNAETPQATLVVQRRAAYLIDRTGVIGSSNPTPAMTYISNN